MNVHQLRRWSDQAGSSLKNSGEVARSGLNTVYSKAMNHPRAATAVLLGTGVAAALLWLANRNGTFSVQHKKTLARARRAPSSSRKSRSTS
jgi:hypothetical protein